MIKYHYFIHGDHIWKVILSDQDVFEEDILEQIKTYGYEEISKATFEYLKRCGELVAVSCKVWGEERMRSTRYNIYGEEIRIHEWD